MHLIEDDLIDLMNRALGAPIRLDFGDNRHAELERKRLYWARHRAKLRARLDRYSRPAPIALDHLSARIRGGTLYLGRAELLNVHGERSALEKRPRPPEQTVDRDDLSAFPPWPPGGVIRRQRPPASSQGSS